MEQAQQKQKYRFRLRRHFYKVILMFMILVALLSQAQSHSDQIENKPMDSPAKLIFETSIGHKQRATGILKKRASNAKQIADIDELNMLIEIPFAIVQGIYQYTVKRGLCQRLDSQISPMNLFICSCHTSDLDHFPKLSIKVEDKADFNEQVLELSALDYLGQPFLDGHSIQCKALISPLSAYNEDIIAASMTDDLYQKISAQSAQKEADLAEKNKKIAIKRQHILTTNYLPISDKPEENLKQASIFMGVIASFLILIYTYLLFKKRKRLAQSKKREEEEKERLRLELENSAENGSAGGGLKRLNTSWQRSITRSNIKEEKPHHTRKTSKSSFVKGSESSDQTSRELSNVVEEHKKDNEKDLKRKSTEQTAIRLDSLNVAKIMQKDQDKSEATTSDNVKTGHEFITSIQETSIQEEDD